MTTEALYHEGLVRLAREARGAGRLEAPDAAATADNPLCGDRVTVELRLAEGRIAGLAHRVQGCVLCQAAASLLGEAAPGATPAEVGEGQREVRVLLAEGVQPPAGRWARLSLFTPVREVASRHRCVLLAFDALAEALARAAR